MKTGFSSLILLSLGHFFIDLYSSALGVFQPYLVERLHLTLTQVGIVGGALVFSSSLLQPVYGLLADRFPTKLFAALGPLVAGVFISSLGLAPSYGWLIALVVLGGVGIASFHPQASARAAAGFTANRGRWMAVFISSGTLGLALGPAFFSNVIHALGLSRTVYMAAFGVAATLVLLVYLPARPPGSVQRQPLAWAPFRAVWRPLTVHYLLVFIRSTVQITFGQLLPLYLHRERGYDVRQASYALSLYLTFGAVGGFLGGQLADRFGGRRVILFSMISCVPCLAVFFGTTGTVSLWGLALGGLTLLFTIPVNVLMAQELVPGQGSTVSALMMGFAWGMAGLIFIPLVGWVADQSSLHFALSLLVVFPFLGFFLTLALPKDQHA